MPKTRAILAKIGLNHKDRGDRFTGITCPACGENEAYFYKNNCNNIICGRNNSCGARTLTRDIFPELYRKTESLPNQNYEVIQYIRSRGLDPEGFTWFEGWAKRGKKGQEKKHKTFSVKLCDDSNFGRLLGYQGKDKAQFGFEAEPQKTIYALGIPGQDKLVITEGVIDAISINQALGFNVASVLSANYDYTQNPTLIEAMGKHKQIIIALDPDRAGIKAIKKLYELSAGLGKNTQVALSSDIYSSKKLDWNDLLCEGNLTELEFENSLHRGTLLIADDIKECHLNTYADIEYKKNYAGVFFFEFRGESFSGKMVKEKDNERIAVNRLCNCIIRFSHAEVFFQPNNEARIDKYVKVFKKDETEYSFLFQESMLNASDFKKVLEKKSGGITFAGLTNNILPEFIEWIEKTSNPREIRKIEALGRDEMTGFWFFGDLAFNQNGQQIGIQNNLCKIKIGRKTDTVILKNEAYWGGSSETFDLGSVINSLHSCWDNKALLALGWFISNLFREEIISSFGHFPLFALYGYRQTGKTTLLNILNSFFGISGDGFSASKSTATNQYLMRQFTKVNSLPLCIKEWNEITASNLTEDQFKAWYDKGAIVRGRAVFSNNNDTWEIPLKSGVLLNQNAKPFRDSAARQRVVDLFFTQQEEDLTEKVATVESLQRLNGKEFLKILMSKYSLIKEEITQEIKREIEVMPGQTRAFPRVRFNYAVCFAGISLFLKHTADDFLLDTYKTKEFLHKQVLNKCFERGGDENVSDFFTVFRENLTSNFYGEEIILKAGIDFVKDEKFYYIRLGEVLMKLRSNQYKIPDKINAMLKALPGVTDNKNKQSKQWKGGDRFCCWWIPVDMID